jgi:hypothetical protein
VPQRYRFRFSLLSALTVMTIIAISIAVLDYPRRRRAAVTRIYDQQKSVVELAATEFEALLEQEGYSVTTHTTQVRGSGEWRYHVEFVGRKNNNRDFDFGLVEIMGFVSHDNKNQPDWWDNLPMKITCHGGSLDNRFAKLLTERLRERKWEFDVKDAAN